MLARSRRGSCPRVRASFRGRGLGCGCVEGGQRQCEGRGRGAWEGSKCFEVVITNYTMGQAIRQRWQRWQRRQRRQRRRTAEQQRRQRPACGRQASGRQGPPAAGRPQDGRDDSAALDSRDGYPAFSRIAASEGGRVVNSGSAEKVSSVRGLGYDRWPGGCRRDCPAVGGCPRSERYFWFMTCV